MDGLHEQITVYYRTYCKGLDAELGTAPMSSLGIVTVTKSEYNLNNGYSITEKTQKVGQNVYRIVLSVRILIQLGTGLFCFCFTASVRLVLNDLWEGCTNN